MSRALKFFFIIRSMQLPLPVNETGLNLPGQLECIAGFLTITDCFHPENGLARRLWEREKE